MEQWQQQIEIERREKDRFLGRHPASPISPADRAAFAGLAYYPPDPAYRFVLPLNLHEAGDTLELQDTAGQVRQLARWAEFRFSIGSTACVLQSYKSDPQEEQLFVPFRDQTSGKETYGAGRYLDLDPDRDRTDDGLWILDLNRAYNPWCAYSDQYACPFVPPENWLPVPIRAGEKQFSLGHGSGG